MRLRLVYEERDKLRQIIIGHTKWKIIQTGNEIPVTFVAIISTMLSSKSACQKYKYIKI